MQWRKLVQNIMVVSMSLKFTSALCVGDKHHVTLSFCEMTPKMNKVSTSKTESICRVDSVVYWPKPNITVGLVSSMFITNRFEYWQKNGYTYDHEFIPHITLGSGDVVSEFSHLIGEALPVHSEYFRIF